MLDVDGCPPEATHELHRPRTRRQRHAPCRLQGFLTLSGLVSSFAHLKPEASAKTNGGSDSLVDQYSIVPRSRLEKYAESRNYRSK